MSPEHVEWIFQAELDEGSRDSVSDPGRRVWIRKHLEGLEFMCAQCHIAL